MNITTGREELLGIIAQRLDVTYLWLNLDERVAFSLARNRALFSRYDVTRWNIPEECEDRMVYTTEIFQIPFLQAGKVFRFVEGIVLVTDPGTGSIHTQEQPKPKFFSWVLRHWRALRSGLLDVTPGELQELSRQLRSAEPADFA